MNEALEQLKIKLEWLSTHNKNYNKQQYYTIMDCLELIEELIKKEKELENFIGEHEHK
jgi:cupin superfamily acireductone dioxygenase involved in methionine salvage